MGNDQLEIEIMEDGTIKTTTGRISAANHKNADEFMAMMARMTGGKTESQKKAQATPTQHHHQLIRR